MAPLFKQMTIAGVGLIGGSLASIARREGLVERIVGLGRSQTNLDVAVERGMLDAATRDPAEAARGADLVVLAVPILSMRPTLERMRAYLKPDAVITDVGSVKGWVVRELKPLLPTGVALVAAHPVAGKETVGAASADPELFRGRRVIITPSAKSTADAIAKVEALWTAAGACVIRMEPDLHDAILARASHLPQIVASVLAAVLAEERVGGLLAADFGASGLRDTTRLAGSSWEIWRDIFISNRDAIVDALHLFGSAIEEFQELLEIGDLTGLERLFNRGRAMREKLVQ